MRIGSTLTIPAAPSRVFERFLDPETMRACIPGCVELERLDDTHYRGLLVNEIAHVRFSASFAAEVTEIEAPRLVRAVLTGEDRRLGSSLKVNATLRVEPQDAQSRVSYEMDIGLWGKLGRLGEPIVRRRSVEIERQFSATFARACNEPAPAAPSTGGPAVTTAVGTIDRPALRTSAVAGPAAPARAPRRAARLRGLLADALERLARWLR
jgi:uncharacterized protein